MRKEKICGIYKIVSPSGKVYIGQAEDIKRRWNSYKYSNIETQIRLYRSFKKHGVENHTFEIIEECLIEDLNCRERYWQDYYDVIGKKGLNCILQSCGEQRRVLSDETRKRMSDNMLGEKHFFYGKNHSEETIQKIKDNHSLLGVIGGNNPFSKKCYQYDLDGNFIKEWFCIQDVERDLGFCNSLIVRCMKGRTRTAHKYQWFYQYKGEKIEPVKVKSCLMSTRNPELLLLIKEIWQVDKNLSLKEISQKANCSYEVIRRMWHKHKLFITGGH